MGAVDGVEYAFYFFVERVTEILRGGEATLYILQRLGWGSTARLLSVPPFIWSVELGYRVVARNRRFFSRFMFRRE